MNGKAYTSASGKKQTRGQVVVFAWLLVMPTLSNSHFLSPLLRFVSNSHSWSPKSLLSPDIGGGTQFSMTSRNFDANRGEHLPQNLEGTDVSAIWEERWEAPVDRQGFLELSDTAVGRQDFSLHSLTACSAHIFLEVELGFSTPSPPDLGTGSCISWIGASSVLPGTRQDFSLLSLIANSGHVFLELEQGFSTPSLLGIGADPCITWIEASSDPPRARQGCSLRGSTSGSLCLWAGNRIRIMLPSH